MNMADRREAKPWHLDKSIPLAYIGFIILQTLSVVVFLTRLDSKVDATMERQTTFEVWRDTQNGTGIKTESRLAVIEERTKEQSETLRRIEDQIEKSTIVRHAR